MNEQQQQALTQYVQKQHEKGTSLGELREQLGAAGHGKNDIDAVFNATDIGGDNNESGDESPPPPPPDQTADSEPSQPSEVSQPAPADQINADQIDGEILYRNTPYSSTDPERATISNSGSGHTRVWLGIGIFLAVLGLAAGGVFAYTQLTKPDLPSFEEVLAANQEIETIKTDTTLSATFHVDKAALQANSEALAQAQRSLQTALGTSEIPAQIRIAWAVDAGWHISDRTIIDYTRPLYVKPSVSVSGDDQTKELIVLELRKLKDTLYILGTQLPTMGFFTLDPLEGQWISIDISEAMEYIEQHPVGPTNRQDLIMALEELPPQAKDKLTGALEKAVSVTNVETGVMLDDGTDAIRYTLALDPIGVYEFMVVADQVLRKHFPESVYSVYQAPESLPTQAEVEAFFQDFTINRFDVWVAQKSYVVRRVLMDVTVPTSHFDKEDTKYFTGGVDFQLDVRNFAHNQPLDITAPEDARPMEEIIGQVFERSALRFQETQVKEKESESEIFEEDDFPTFDHPNPRYMQNQGPDGTRQDDITQLRTALSLYHYERGAYPQTLSQSTIGDYMSVPTDPETGEPYLYTRLEGEDNYCLGACLESEEVPDNHTASCEAVLPTCPARKTLYAIDGE